MPKSILLVEDNPDDATLIIRALSGHNMLNKIVVAEDGQEALDYLFCEGKHADRSPSCELPAVVLLDLSLPKVHGLEVLRIIRENERVARLPVVILTTAKEDEEVAKSYALRANSYIRKPVDFQEFMNVVRQIGFYWVLLNERPPSLR